MSEFDVFLDSKDPLRVMNAVTALLVLEDGRYILQLRDNKPHIFYLGHWGLFGGVVDEGEDEAEALRRELQEELGFAPRHLSLFVRLAFDLSTIGAGQVYHAVYAVLVLREEMSSFELREGLTFDAVTPHKVLADHRVTPYDSFAIWMHHARERLVPASAHRPAAYFT